MAETKDFQCPNCGSPLDLHGEQNEVKCPYCGSRVIVPEELRPRRSPAPVFSAPVYNLPNYNEQISKQVATAGKVAAGIAVITTIAPLIVTGVILCIVAVFVGFILFTVNSTISSVSNLDPQALQTAIIATMDLPTAVPTREPPSPAPTELPTLPPTPLPFATPFSQILFHDDFTAKKSWSVFKDSDYTLAYVKGGYRIFLNSEGGQASWLDNISYTDINITAQISYTDGPSDGRFGVSCRVKKRNFYSFEFSPNGWYAIEKYTSSENGSVSSTLAEGQMDTSAFSKDAIFHLRGDCVGDTLTLYLNDAALLQVTDTSFASGGIGVIANTGVSGAGGVDVLFRDYTVTGNK